jgi:hypothetical protein
VAAVVLEIVPELCCQYGRASSLSDDASELIFELVLRGGAARPTPATPGRGRIRFLRPFAIADVLAVLPS